LLLGKIDSALGELLDESAFCAFAAQRALQSLSLLVGSAAAALRRGRADAALRDAKAAQVELQAFTLALFDAGAGTEAQLEALGQLSTDLRRLLRALSASAAAATQ
jgi:hypothetical protein